MIQEKHLDLVIAIIIISCGVLVTFEASQWVAGDNINLPQKSPVSQTEAQVQFGEFSEFNGVMDNELREFVDNATKVQVWSDNETELLYRGTIGNYSGAQYVMIINKSLVDTIKVVQP